MSHTSNKQRADQKRELPHDFDDELLELINQAVKDKADKREPTTPQPPKD